MTKGAKLVCQLLAWITAGPALVFNWFNNRGQLGTSRSQSTANLRTGIRTVKRKVTSVQTGFRRFRDQRMRRFDWLLAIVALTLLLTDKCAGSETVSIVTKSEISSIKRCPTAGSCRGNYCSEVTTDSLIPELKEVNGFPGKSFCVDSSSFWQNQCGLPASACLYYRWYARTTSRPPFEVVSCPAWDVTFPVDLRLELTGGKSWNTELILRPGMTSNWGNISITPLSVSLPPMPTLSNRFITNGRATALIQHVPTHLHCADEDAARKFNCSLDIDTCKDCKPNHEEGSVSCHCQDVDVEGILENPMARLPITVAKVYVYNEGPAIYAEHSYSPVQLHVQMKDLQLILEFRDSKCWIEPISLVGCYKCPTGAQLRYKCRTDWGTALAKVECDDGVVFATQCTTNNTEKMIVLPFDRSLIASNCVVDCPAGETSFNISAELHYIPLKRQFGHKQRLSERLETEPDEGWNWPMDFSFDPFAIIRLWASVPLLLMSGGVGFPTARSSTGQCDEVHDGDIVIYVTMEPAPIKEKASTTVTSTPPSKTTRCSSCVSKGVPQPHGHRACDKACPYFSEWRQQQKIKSGNVQQQTIEEEEVAIANLKMTQPPEQEKQQQHSLENERAPAETTREMDQELKKGVMREAAKLITSAPGCDPLEELACVDADLSSSGSVDQKDLAKWAINRLRERLALTTNEVVEEQEEDVISDQQHEQQEVPEEEEGLILSESDNGQATPPSEKESSSQQLSIERERQINDKKRLKSYRDRKRGFRDAKTKPSQLAMAAMEGNRKLNEENAALARDPKRLEAAKTAHRAAVKVLRRRDETTDEDSKEKRLKAIEEGPGWRYRTFSKLPDKGGLKERDPKTTQILRKEKAAALRTADFYLKRADEDRADLAALLPEKRQRKE
uniref:Phlebovirus glycoprotein G2 fusion domain-containing protein n=1 Tax=Meloidogyne javanica TaxID=6303 RepID=A0A915N7Q1_MELJA